MNISFGSFDYLMILVVGFAGYIVYRAVGGSLTVPRLKQDAADAPIIAAGGLLESPSLLGVDKGKMAGFDYVLLTNGNDRVMLVVTLPQNTWLHVIAVGDKSHAWDGTIHEFSRRWLEPVSLEGDFPQRFEMYVSKGSQVEVRELFTPDVMMNFYELCRTYDFEIFNESVYFSVADGVHDSGDTTPMVEDAEQFLQKNAAFFDGLGQGTTAPQ